MKIAIMQPYFFPYIGYFQLINAVDTFVIYDDVNYIKQGWINRNRILLNNISYLFTLQLNGSSSFKKINEIELGVNRHKILKTFKLAYNHAPYFHIIFPIIEEILLNEEKNLAKFVEFSIKKISKILDTNTHYVLSSEVEKNNESKGQEKVIEICKKLGGDTYINTIGGLDLYGKVEFKSADIILQFLKTNPIVYKQNNNEFIPNLSILDILMFNSKDEVKEMLNNYNLV